MHISILKTYVKGKRNHMMIVLSKLFHGDCTQFR